MKKVLVTGIAGFIGSHLAKRLYEKNYDVIGIDNLNDYYSVELKEDRLNLLLNNNVKNYNINLENYKDVEKVFNHEKPEVVINLAAQAGVRYSLENPHVYITSNINGFTNILEACRHNDVQNLIYAS